MPAVIATRRFVGSPLPYVGPDNAKGTRMAVEHLLRLGHRRIAFLGGDRSMNTQEERSGGWRDALNAAGFAADAALVVEAPATREGGRIALAKALSLSRPPTAALCYNDMVGIGATRELAVRRIAPGRDFAVVGFGDIAEAEYNAPPLTTVSAGAREMGRRRAESLLGLIRREDPAGLSYAGEPRLIVRESCGASLKQRMAS